MATERPFVLLPAGHRPAGHPTLTTDDLRSEETFRGHPPLRAVEELTELVAVGRLIVVVGESAAARAGAGVAAVQVADLPDTPLLLARREDGLPAVVKRFLAVAADPVRARDVCVRDPAAGPRPTDFQWRPRNAVTSIIASRVGPA